MNEYRVADETTYMVADETANARVLGMAGVASGVIGGLVAAAMERSANRKRAEAEAAAVAAADSSSDVGALLQAVRSNANESLSRAMSRAPQSREEWNAAAQRLKEQAAASAKESQKRSKERLSDADLRTLSRQALAALPASQVSERVEQLRKRADAIAGQRSKPSSSPLGQINLGRKKKKVRKSLTGMSSDAATSAAELATAAAQRSRDVVGAVKHQSPQALNRAEQAVTEARSYGEHLLEQAKDRAPELVENVQQSLAPRVKELRSSASPILGAASTALATGTDAGREIVSQLKNSADRELSPALKDRAGSAVKTLGDVSSQASDKWSGVSVTVEERSREAAHVAAQGTRDTGAIVAWSAVAGGLIYYAFMDEEQRTKLKQSVGRIGQEAREIYRDVQGYDDTFTEA